MADSRILAGAATTLSWQPVDSDGEAAAPEGTVTVGITRADGTALIAPGTVTAGALAEPRTIILTGAQTAALDLLIATWTDAGGGTATTYHDIVGGHYFTVAELRAAENKLASPAKYSAPAIIEARAQVEAEFEAITGFAFVPRYCRVRIPGKGLAGLTVPHYFPRTVRAVWGYTFPGTYAIFDTLGLAALELDTAGVVRDFSGGCFTRGTDYVIAYEHGWNAPPSDIKRVAMARARYFLTKPDSPIAARAGQYTSQEGTVVFALVPGGDKGRRTGDPDTDAALARHVHDDAPFA